MYAYQGSHILGVPIGSLNCVAKGIDMESPSNAPGMSGSPSPIEVMNGSERLGM
jgi:hypothetical protein